VAALILIDPVDSGKTGWIERADANYDGKLSWAEIKAYCADVRDRLG